MSETMIQCPGCGEMFPPRLGKTSENGNTICPECRLKELEQLEKESENK